MKSIAYAVIAAGILACGPWSGAARAEEGAPNGDRRAHFAAKMKERLGLSDEQADKVKTAFESEKAAVKPLREARKAAARKLEQQVRDLASEKDIQATLDGMDANRKAMAAERQKLQGSLAGVLKPSQRAKMRLFMASRRTHRRSHGRHGGKSFGGWRHERQEHD
ncbi:MAG: Spy/CpxP family protein refolding chaperone [Elusimicrobiota bacterium]